MSQCKISWPTNLRERHWQQLQHGVFTKGKHIVIERRDRVDRTEATEPGFHFEKEKQIS